MDFEAADDEFCRYHWRLLALRLGHEQCQNDFIECEVKPDGLPNWRTIYQSAVLESDSSTGQERIAQAEEAIKCRLEALKSGTNDSSEGRSLANALTVLLNLRKIMMANRTTGNKVCITMTPL